MSNRNIEYMDEPSFEVFTEGRMLVALLEMAADAESRIPTAMRQP